MLRDINTSEEFCQHPSQIISGETVYIRRRERPQNNAARNRRADPIDGTMDSMEHRIE